MKADVIVGALWGDEGKGKWVGAKGRHYDAVLRVNASTNAGHRVCDGRASDTTRQLPSVFFPGSTMLVVAPGALVNLLALAEEVLGRPDLDSLRGKVRVASSVALVLEPYVQKGQGGMSALLGSTHQGTGPAAAARAARHALHLWDVQSVARGHDPSDAEEKLLRTCMETLPGQHAASSPESRSACARMLRELVAAFRELESRLGEFCVDYTALLRSELSLDGKRILIEGCNGLLLDNLHGAHPHVTSASTNLGAMLCGANLSPGSVRTMIVVAAAYCTCLGKRPFPTELTDSEAARFRARCNEVDVAEGQPRRLGWIDLPALRKALVGCHGAVLHLNKLDVLTGLPRIRVCTHYRIGDRDVDVLPDDPAESARAVAQYSEVAGWEQDLSTVRSPTELCAAAQDYVRLLQASLPIPIASLGVGPRNEDLVDLV